MIKVPITHQQIVAAWHKAETLGRLNKFSHRGKEDIFQGRIGELMFATAFPQFAYFDQFNYDFVYGNWRLDVKTQGLNSLNLPKPYYAARILAHQRERQDTDFIVFARICRAPDGSIPHGYLVGWISKDEFYQRARFVRKGEPESNNGFVAQADCYVLPVADLWNIHQLRDYCAGGVTW